MSEAWKQEAAYWEGWQAARREALEEAARVADAEAAIDDGTPIAVPRDTMVRTELAGRIASRIRKLMEKE